MEREIEKLRKDLHESRQQSVDLHEQLALERENTDKAKIQVKAALRDTRKQCSETIESVKGKEKEKRQRSMMSANETSSEAQEKLKAYD